MSASFEEQGSLFFVKNNKLDLFIQAEICRMFDEMTDYDIQDIRKSMAETKLLKKMCLLKTINFPIEYLFTRIAMGKTLAKDRYICQGIYWKYMRNKISTEEFKRALKLSLKAAMQ